MSDLLSYAKNELNKIGKDKDGLQDMINKDILDIVEIFNNQGHSGFSANYAINILNRLLRYKPIAPLTGEDDEWMKIEKFGPDDETVYQNKRCYSVFKYSDGRCVDNDAILVSDNGGHTWFGKRDFTKEVTFPYYPSINPEKVYIEYTEDIPRGYSSDKYEVITNKPERIKALFDKFSEEVKEAYENE